MPTPNRPGLIITADDYGLNDSCNKGTLEGVKYGIVTSVHVMTNIVTDEAMQMLIQTIQDYNPSCGIGLHLNTTWGAASIQRKTSFTKEATRKKKSYYKYKELKHYCHATTDFEEMKEEFAAQFTRLLDFVGSADKVDAISSHYNMHFWDSEFIHKLKVVLGANMVPVRSTVRWTTGNQIPKPPYYKKGILKGEGPLVKVALPNIIKNATEWSTIELLKTSQNEEQLHALQDLLTVKYKLKCPRNNTGHWFGQPEWKAMHWFMNALSEINVQSNGYFSEVFMHLAKTTKGVCEKYDYPMKKRVKEYEVITDNQFIQNFKHLKTALNINHGSYRTVLGA